MKRTVRTEEDPITGDLILPIPDDMMERLGWKEGDNLRWSRNDDGTWTLTKIEKEYPMKLKTGTSDRFDLEQDIMKAWSILDDINLLNEYVANKDLDRDHLTNYLLGLHTIYEARFEKMWDTFEKCIKNGDL